MNILSRHKIVVGFLLAAAMFWYPVQAQEQTGSDNTEVLASTEAVAPEIAEISQEADANVDPNTNPERTEPEPNLVDLSLPDANEPVLAEGGQENPFWQPKYHPQVTKQVYYLLGYPYYAGGMEYSGENPGDTSEEEITGSNSPSDPNVSVDPNQIDQVEHTVRITGLQAGKLIYTMEKSCDVIHQWRTLNESPAIALEIIYSVELTKASTHIYEVNPELAVKVKRTIGQIRQLNQKFDATSRLVFQGIVDGQLDEKTFAHMEKEFTELKALFTRLADQNDSISVALGVGKINRNASEAMAGGPVSFSRNNLPAPETLTELK